MQVEPVRAQKGGRPMLPPNRRRSEAIRLRLSPDEADAAYQFAIKHGEPLNRILRALLLRHIRTSS